MLLFKARFVRVALAIAVGSVMVGVVAASEACNSAGLLLYTWAVAPTSCTAPNFYNQDFSCENLYDALPTATDINTAFTAGGTWNHGEWANRGTSPAVVMYTYATPQLVNQMCFHQRDTGLGSEEYWSTVQLFFDGSATSAATINLNQDTLLRCYDLPSAQRVSTVRMNFVRTTNPNGANPGGRTLTFVYKRCASADQPQSPDTPRTDATSRLPVGSLVYGASGDIAALDIGRLGYYLGGVGSDSSRASVPPSVTVGFLEAPGIAWTGSQASDASNWRLLAPPHGTRSRTGWFANVALRLFVAADECVVTRLYVLDYDSTARRVRVTATDASGNAVSLTTGESFHDGAWLTFEQRGTTEYRIEVVEGPNAALSGITFDTCDGSAPATNTPAPTCEAEYTWADAPTSCSARFDAEHPTLICQNLYDVLPTATDINTEFFAGGSWYHGEWAGLGTAPATLMYTYATPQLVNQMCYQQRFTNRGPDEYWSTVQLFFDGSATSAATINLNQDTLLRCYDLPSTQRVSTARLDFVRTNPSGMNPGGRTVTFVHRCASAQPQAPGSDPRPPSAVAPAQRQSDDDGEEVSIEVIVIAALGCAVVVLLAIVLGCFCARRKSGDAGAVPITASVPAALVMPADASAAGPAPMQEAHGQAVMGAVVCDSSPVAKPSAPLGYGVNAAHYNYPAQPSATSHVPSVVAAALPQTPDPDEDGIHHNVEPVN